jgi:hypothetical protein
MSDKVNGTSKGGEFLTKNLNYYKIRTLVNLTASTSPTDANQINIDKLVETISLRAQPVVLDFSTSVEDKAAITDIPAASALPSGNNTVYVLKFAIEHDAWEGATPSLASSLNGVGDFVFTSPTTNNNLAVTFSNTNSL